MSKLAYARAMQTPHPDIVRDAIQRSAIAKAELARRAAIHPNSLNGVEQPAWDPRWSTLRKLCDAVDEIKRERA